MIDGFRVAIGFAMMGMCLWRLVRIQAFVAEDVKWLHERFLPAETDTKVAVVHSALIAAGYGVLGALIVFA